MTTDATVHSAAPLAQVFQDRNTQTFWTAATVGIEVAVIAASACLAFAAYNLTIYGVVPDRITYVWAALAVALVYGGLCIADNQYDLLGTEWNEHGRARGIAAIALAFAILLTIGYITDNLNGYSRGTYLAQFIFALLVQIVTRTILWQVIDQARTRGHWQRTTMVMLVLPGARKTPDPYQWTWTSSRYQKIVRRYDLGSSRDEAWPSHDFDTQLCMIRRECRALRVDAVLVAFGADNMALVTHTVSAISELPVRIQLLPLGMAEFMQSSRIGNCGRTRVLELVSGPCSLRDRLLKRSMDIAAAATLLVLLSPLLAIVAILIKLDSRGPVLFRQTRHGFNNEPIQVLKFRSMTTFDDSTDKFQQAMRNDPRITRVGRIIRRTNIDELPQLINVIKDDMSMVGPRPHAVAHNDMYADQIGRMSRRHTVKPGITGWAQVNGLRGETDTVEKMSKRVEYDLYYIDNWSLFFDVKIMIMTLISKNAYANAY